MHDDRERLVDASIELRTCSRRIILRIRRRQEAAFTSGIALPW